MEFCEFSDFIKSKCFSINYLNNTDVLLTIICVTCLDNTTQVRLGMNHICFISLSSTHIDDNIVIHDIRNIIIDILAL